MLCVHIAVGESILAEGRFELQLSSYENGMPCFLLTVLKRTPWTIIRGGATELSGGNCYPGSPQKIVATFESRIRVGYATVVVHRHRASCVKLGVDAPKDIKISRPAQHGGTLQAV